MRNLIFIVLATVLIYGCNTKTETKEDNSEIIHAKHVDEIEINDLLWNYCHNYNKYNGQKPVKIIYGYETGWSIDQVNNHTEKLMQQGLFTMGVNNEPHLKITTDDLDLSVNAFLSVPDSELEQYQLTIKRDPMNEMIVDRFMVDNYGDSCLKSKQDSSLVWVMVDKAIVMAKNERLIKIAYTPYSKHLMEEISKYGDGLIRPLEWRMNNWEEFVKKGRIVNKLKEMIGSTK